jgi:hypothetical protein
VTATIVQIAASTCGTILSTTPRGQSCYEWRMRGYRRRPNWTPERRWRGAVRSVLFAPRDGASKFESDSLAPNELRSSSGERKLGPDAYSPAGSSTRGTDGAVGVAATSGMRTTLPRNERALSSQVSVSA